MNVKTCAYTPPELLYAFDGVQTMLMDLGYVGELLKRTHDLGKLPIEFGKALIPFCRALVRLCRALVPFVNHQLNGLGQRFVPLGELVYPLFKVHCVFSLGDESPK